VSKALARLGLKFSKGKPESFSPEYSQVIELHCEVRLRQDQYLQLIEEIRKSKTSEKAIVEPILSKMTELARNVRDAVDQSSKLKVTQLKEVRDLTKEIEELLSAKGELSFTRILESLQTTAPTLSKYLDRLVAGSKLERREVGQNVLYKLKRGE